jgi:hypothetical protein
MLRKMGLLVMLLFVMLIYAAAASAAARTVLTPISVPASYATSGVLLEWTEADTANGNRFVNTGREILLVDNTGADTVTVTVSSVADPYGRTGDATKSVAAGTSAVFQMFPTAGWQQSDGYIYVDCTAVDDVNLAVIRLP